MHQGHAGDPVVNARALWAWCADDEVTAPDQDEVGVVDVEAQPLADEDAQRPKRLLAEPCLDLFGAEPGNPLVAEDAFLCILRRAPP